jgi:hypothetical protein
VSDLFPAPEVLSNAPKQPRELCQISPEPLFRHLLSSDADRPPAQGQVGTESVPLQGGDLGPDRRLPRRHLCRKLHLPRADGARSKDPNRRVVHDRRHERFLTVPGAQRHVRVRAFRGEHHPGTRFTK